MAFLLTSSSKQRQLPDAQHLAFTLDVDAGMSDRELAVKYGLSDRTATNYRIRALAKILSVGGELPPRWSKFRRPPKKERPARLPF